MQRTVKHLNVASKIRLYLSIASARKAVAGRVIVNRFTRDIKTKTTHATTNKNNKNIQDGEGDLPGRRKPLASVDVQPVNTSKTIAEPTSEEGTDQTEKVAEDWDGVGDDPSDDPAAHADSHPGSDRCKVAAVHAVSSAEETDVDVFQTNVAVDNTGTDDLGNISYGRKGT
jgi:hypothetical protein